MTLCAHNAIFLVISLMEAIVVKDISLVLNFFVSSKCVVKGAWRLAVCIKASDERSDVVLLGESAKRNKWAIEQADKHVC